MDNKEEKFIRWQKIQIEQMSFVINLIISLSIAILAFFATLLADDNLKLDDPSKIYFTLSLLSIVLSIIFGILLSINRLYDFKYSKDINKYKLLDENKNKEIIIELRVRTKCIGKRSWLLLYLQIIPFISTIILFFLYLSLKYNLFSK